MTSGSLRAAVEHLAAIDRGSCSQGEREAAEWIAASLREYCESADVEVERVHGTYWWPLGLTAALGVVAGVAGARGRRAAGAVLGGLASALVIDDVGAGHRWLRRVLPKRPTANVIARTGDPHAERMVMLVAHHDAAHTAIFFNPRIAEVIGRSTQGSAEGPMREPAVTLPVALGPAFAALASALGRRRLARVAGAICAATAASFMHIGLSPTVPGANDNLSGVATLLGVAAALKERPVRGLRVLLVSTGAEEALWEGMRAFAARHLPELSAGRTHLICVDSVGSPRLVLAEAEGNLQVLEYDRDLTDLLARCASDAGVTVRRGVTVRFGTDGYVALRHGVPAALLLSINEYGAASNYHWRTDTPDRLDYGSLDGAVTICECAVRRLAVPAPAAPA